MANDDAVQAIRARLAAATPGPWRVMLASKFGTAGTWYEVDAGPYTWSSRADASFPHRPADAEFIANAPADIAYLDGALTAANDARAAAEERADFEHNQRNLRHTAWLEEQTRAQQAEASVSVLVGLIQEVIDGVESFEVREVPAGVAARAIPAGQEEAWGKGVQLFTLREKTARGDSLPTRIPRSSKGERTELSGAPSGAASPLGKGQANAREGGTPQRSTQPGEGIGAEGATQRRPSGEGTETEGLPGVRSAEGASWSPPQLRVALGREVVMLAMPRESAQNLLTALANLPARTQAHLQRDERRDAALREIRDYALILHATNGWPGECPGASSLKDIARAALEAAAPEQR